MEGFNRRRGLSPPKFGNHSSSSIDSTTSSDTMIDSATTPAVTAQLFLINNDNGGPSSDPHITSASSVKPYTTDLSGLNTPSDSAHHSDHAMPEVQGDHQPSTQNQMAIAFILNRDSPQPNGFSDSSKVIGDSTAHDKQSGSASSATQQKERLRGRLSRMGSENLEKNRLMYLDQIESAKKSIRDLAGGSLGITSADISISSIARWNEIIQRRRHRLAHIVRHQAQRREAERKAKESCLQLMANGTKSTVYAIPENFGNSVIQVGTREIMTRKRQNLLLVEQAFAKMSLSTANRSPSSKLMSLLLPQIENIVPIGFVGDSATGLVRPCTSLNPRIPSFNDTNSKRRSADPDEQFGIVLRRIRGLNYTSRSNIYESCFPLLNAKMREALCANEDCLVRIHLGKTFDDEDLDHAADSVSDVTMTDAGEASATTVNDESLPTLNLPLCLDHIINHLDTLLFPSLGHTEKVLKRLAHNIASGYAGLHWGARLDARGIEFVLGSSPSGLGMQLYMLDFEDCRPIESLTRLCVQEQLVPAALENDPYIPRLACGSGCACRHFNEAEPIKDRIWNAFRGRYLEDSAKIWEASGHDFERDLPGFFIDQLEKGFVDRDTQRLANGHVSEAPYLSVEYDRSDDEEDFENDGGDGANQAQADHEFFEHDNSGSNGYDLDTMEIDDSSEGEEDSEDEDDDEEDSEDDDDFDDVD